MSTGKKIVYYLAILLSLGVIAASLLSLLHDVNVWWIKALDFPRVQGLAFGVGCALILIVLTNRWSVVKGLLVAGLVASVGLQSYFIMPYTPWADKALKSATPKEVASSPKIRLLIANVYMHNRQADDFLAIVADANPDMVLVMETNQWWIDALQPLESQYPHSWIYPADNTYGMGLYSRYPLADQQAMFFNHDSVPSFHTAIQLPDGQSFRFHGVHPVPPIHSQHPDNKGKKEVAIMKVGALVTQQEEPAIVAGDFNDVAWSNTGRLFQVEGQLLDARVGRGLLNSFDATSWFLRWPLDHVYTTDHFRLVEFRRLEEFGSDHFPIYAELVLIDTLAEDRNYTPLPAIPKR